MPHYVATAFIFSGRRDPTWDVPPGTTSSLEAIWEALEPSKGPGPSPPPLGYKGSAMRSDKGLEYVAYGGVVTRRVKREVDIRRDKGRVFEKTLLMSAPRGTLPADILRIAGIGEDRPG